MSIVSMCSLFVLLLLCSFLVLFFFFFKQKTAYEMRISDWSSDVCSSDLAAAAISIGVKTPVPAVVPEDERTPRDEGQQIVIVAPLFGSQAEPRRAFVETGVAGIGPGLPIVERVFARRPRAIVGYDQPAEARAIWVRCA